MYFRSHPVWVCGLKLLHTDRIHFWNQSHPVWVCGLKREKEQKFHLEAKSHPVWVCGLKHLGSANTVPQVRHTLYGCVD